MCADNPCSNLSQELHLAKLCDVVMPVTFHVASPQPVVRSSVTIQRRTASADIVNCFALGLVAAGLDLSVPADSWKK